MLKICSYRLIAVTFLALSTLSMAAAGINKGFFKKAAKTVWEMPSENLFDPKKEIPAEVSRGQSAVVIARHDDFGKRIEQNTIYESSGRTNRTSLKHVRRSMVKLLDASAIEYYGEFEFGNTHEKHDYGIEPMIRIDRAFGVRIHKPDGKIVDIDPSTALEVSDGKKGGKNQKFKLAVPGLEVNDVIEYFYYTEYENDNGDIELVDVMLADIYPVMARLMTGSFDPTLTIELKAYNGAPLCVRSKDKENNTIRMFCENLPAVSFRKFLYEEAQLPMVRVNTLNHHLAVDDFTSWQPKTQRGAGIYQNIPGERIQLEGMECTAQIAYLMWKSPRPISPIPGKAEKMVKDFRKAHPEATPRQLADAAWLAVNYQALTSKDDIFSTSAFFRALFHNSLVEKLDIFPREVTGIAMANSRDEVPIQEMSKWDQTTFMSIVGDTTYNMSYFGSYLPGEIPARFQAMPAVRITGRLRDLTYGDKPEYYDLPDRKYIGNKANFFSKVSLDPDDNSRLIINREASLSGSAKSTVGDFNDYMDWIVATEDYFGIPEGKRYKSKTYSYDDRKKELASLARKECRENLGVEVDTITNFTISQRGIMPGQNSLEYSMDCVAGDLVEDLGDGLSISFGKLLGNRTKLAEHERERLLDVMLFSAATEIQRLIFVVPQGYKVDETSLANFNANISNPVGQYIVQAKLDDDGNIELQCVHRIKHHSIALQAWPMFRDILDTDAQFTDASIILTKL